MLWGLLFYKTMRSQARVTTPVMTLTSDAASGPWPRVSPASRHWLTTNPSARAGPGPASRVHSPATRGHTGRPAGGGHWSRGLHVDFIFLFTFPAVPYLRNCFLPQVVSSIKSWVYFTIWARHLWCEIFPDIQNNNIFVKTEVTRFEWKYFFNKCFLYK